MAYDVKILKGVVSKATPPPNMAPSELARLMKGKSSFRLQQEVPELKKRYWGQHILARGYFCSSVGIVDEETVRCVVAVAAQRALQRDGDGR